MTSFLELSELADAGVICCHCFESLPRTGTAFPGPGYIAFWLSRCPHCNHPHIIWNSTSVLPPIQDTPPPAAATSAPNQAPLL